jgi:hypothetical protein
MIRRPDNIGRFEFARVAGLRAVQLMRGCTPRLKASPQTAVTAQMEVAERLVVREPDSAPADQVAVDE